MTGDGKQSKTDENSTSANNSSQTVELTTAKRAINSVENSHNEKFEMCWSLNYYLLSLFSILFPPYKSHSSRGFQFNHRELNTQKHKVEFQSITHNARLRRVMIYPGDYSKIHGQTWRRMRPFVSLGIWSEIQSHSRVFICYLCVMRCHFRFQFLLLSPDDCISASVELTEKNV